MLVYAHCSQLNMGEGKTRVTLPMLALHWADGSRVVRLNFLPALIDEAYAHLHLVLTASSLLQRKLFTLPFHRDVKPTESNTAAVRASLHYCQTVRELCCLPTELPGHTDPKQHARIAHTHTHTRTIFLVGSLLPNGKLLHSCVRPVYAFACYDMHGRTHTHA